MKIKLTESQYNRLLTEDTGENWGRVSKTVNPFMVKVFEKIRDKIQNGELKMNYNIVDIRHNTEIITRSFYFLEYSSKGNLFYTKNVFLGVLVSLII